MAHYLLGDIQGCDEVLARLLQEVDFSPSRDTLYPLGDLVNRGPSSAQVLRRLLGYGSSAKPILGNHDISLLALASQTYQAKPRDTMADILTEPDAPALLHWLRQQPLARYEWGVLMVHAGVLPHWTVAKTLKWAQRLHRILCDKDLSTWLPSLWGNPSYAWSKELTRKQKLRLALNAFTRMRFCDAQGRQDYNTKTNIAPAGYYAWFDVPGRKTESCPIAFGHWSTLGLWSTPYTLGLDTGCVWGGSLSTLRMETAWPLAPSQRQIIQVSA